MERSPFQQLFKSKLLSSPYDSSLTLQKRCVGQHTTRHREWLTHFRRILRGPSLSDSLEAIYRLLARQCNVYAGQRVRRLQQMWYFYSSLYSESALQTIVVNFARRNMRPTRRPIYYLFGAACFTWDRERITDNDIQRYIASDKALLDKLFSSSTLQKTFSLPSWQLIIDRQHLKVWRKPLESDYLYEYKVYGKFYDISARSFLRVNMDLDYRKIWDKLVIRLQLLERDEVTGSEVVYWVSHFPFPMQSRDYVYVRRCKVDHRSKTMYLVSKSLDHPGVPQNKNHVRVTSYESSLVIKPHRSFEENGFDYIMTYHDDPKAPIPTAAVKWMTAEGFPKYIETMHEATRHLDSFLPPREGELSGAKESKQYMPSLNTNT